MLTLKPIMRIQQQKKQQKNSPHKIMMNTIEMKIIECVEKKKIMLVYCTLNNLNKTRPSPILAYYIYCQYNYVYLFLILQFFLHHFFPQIHLFNS